MISTSLTGDTNDVVVDCFNPNAPTQRVILNPTLRTVTFHNCHQARSGLGIGLEPERVCSFDEILATYDFLTGEHRGQWLRALFFLGPLVGVHVRPAAMSSIFISTTAGRARIFAEWIAFTQLRSQLREICSQHPRKGNWSDNPAFGPLFLIVIFGIVGVLIWFLL